MPAILTKAKTYLGAGMEHGRTKEINAQEVQIKRLDQQLIELTKAVSDSKNKKSWW
nr:Vitamin-B12 independent methionine synthase [Moritella viscosa]